MQYIMHTKNAYVQIEISLYISVYVTVCKCVIISLYITAYDYVLRYGLCVVGCVMSEYSKKVRTLKSNKTTFPFDMNALEATKTRASKSRNSMGDYGKFH